MGNALNPGQAAAAAPPPAAGPTDGELRARAEGAREALERENERLRGLLTRPGAPAPPPVPAGPDPLKLMTSEILTGNPDDLFNNLDNGVRGRVRQEVGPVLGRMRQEILGELNNIRTESAFANVFAANPDIAQDKEGLAGAMARAAHRANSQNMTLSQSQLVEEGVRIYRESKPAPAPNLESGYPGSGLPAAEAKPAGPSLYEKFYGKNDDDEIHEEDWNPKSETENYADDKNGYLDEFHVNTATATLAAENADRNRRKKTKAAAGG